MFQENDPAVGWLAGGGMSCPKGDHTHSVRKSPKNDHRFFFSFANSFSILSDIERGRPEKRERGKEKKRDSPFFHGNIFARPGNFLPRKAINHLLPFV